MLGLEVDAACWGDDFNRHRIVAAPVLSSKKDAP
jgi:hypothetical protein